MKRMAASFMIAARNNGFTKADARAVTTASVTAYREAMAGFAQMRTMDIWYAHLAEEDILRGRGRRSKGKDAAKDLKRAKKNIEKARTRDSLQALSKLAELVDGSYRIVSQPPIVVPLRDLADTYGLSPAEMDNALHEQFRAYRQTLQERPASPARAVPDRRRRPQGRRSRQRRNPRVDRAAPGKGRTGPAVPAGQGSLRVGARGPPAEEPLQAARRARRPRTAPDAGRQRHLPRLDAEAPTSAATSTGGSCAT